MDKGIGLDANGSGRSGLDTDPVTKSSKRGRILKMRMGVNPNSSGHGVLFGSMFFIPYSVLSSLVANAVIPRPGRCAGFLSRHAFSAVRR
jgi:hypothetical protein